MVSQASQQTILPSNILSAGNDDYDVDFIEASIQRAVTSVMNNGDIFVVETSSARNNDQNQIVIEGEKTGDDKRHAICMLLLGCIALASVAVTAIGAMISLRVSASNNQSIPPTMVPITAANSSTMTHLTVASWNGNRTIVNALTDSQGPTIAMVPGGRLFIELMNRSDTNFTFFDIVKGLKLSEENLSLLVSKLVSPLWSSHMVSSASWWQ